jgi:hypothetical protein
MSLKTRGRGANIRITADGDLQAGSMIKVRDFTATPRSTIDEDDYLGEDETDLDFQHHGWDVSFSIDTIDDASINYVDDQITRFQKHQRPADITMTVIYTFSDPSIPGRAALFHLGFVKQDEESFGGRKEIIRGKYSGKFKRRELLNV